MNYKLMQRPMFRLGGNVRQNYNTGTPFSETLKGLSTQELMQMQAASADKSLAGLDSLRDLVRLQTLGGFTANVLPNIQTRNPLRFISEFLSNPETVNLALKGLGGLRSVDTKAGEIKRSAISDKIKGQISLETLDISRAKANKELDREVRLRLGNEADQLLQSVGGDRNKLSPSQLSEYERKMKIALGTGFLTKQEAKAQAYDIAGRTFDVNAIGQKKFMEEVEKIASSLYYGTLAKKDLASGGRVNFQEGTPDPTLPQPKPKGPMDDRKVENLMRAAPALENPGEVKEMAMEDKDVFAALRRRLPQEITDDVVRLIAYNPEAFADFADISDQSDVDSFNEKYNVQLVLPVENVT